jgi:hypothetical protein
MTTHEQEFHEDEATPQQSDERAEPEILATAENATARSERASHKERTRRQSPRRAADERALTPLPVSEQTPEPVCEDDSDDSAMHALEAQGFTQDEAIRLIHVSDRLKTSREARESEAVLRRLRFTRWLIQQGMLDEFSA